jgi:mRNA-degrading endonuclease RelE of RelBE toxin-antitoxin system
VPLNRWFALLGQSLALLSCQPSSDEALRANPAAGQALAVALEVSQVARATAESLALSPAAGCRPSTVCGTGPATITTTITLRRQERSGALETVERTVWTRDDQGNVGLALQRSTPAPAGGQTSNELLLRSIGDDRFGALDGRFVKATVAPLLDERLAADPQAASNVRRLVGLDAYRLRVGEWRVVYELDRGALVVIVIRIASRAEAYE